MNAGELIEKLKLHPSDMEVFIEIESGSTRATDLDAYDANPPFLVISNSFESEAAYLAFLERKEKNETYADSD